MTSVVHTAESITEMLRLGMTPITDNQCALVQLGFERAYPQVSRGYDATIWERSIEPSRRADGKRELRRQRAYLAAKK